MIQQIQQVLTPDLLSPEWRKLVKPGDHPTRGHCYAASEAAYHLFAKAQGYRPMVLPLGDGQTHWFLKNETGDIIDVTAEQFSNVVDYSQAHGCGWLTGDNPSKGCQEIMCRVKPQASVTIDSFVTRRGGRPQAPVTKDGFVTKKGGRPRKYKTNAKRQAAFRRRKAMRAAQALRRAGELVIVPLHHRQANELVATLHRHHTPLNSAKLSIGVAYQGRLVGCAMMARPAARALDKDLTVEIARVAVEDNVPNACSLLYGRCAAIAKLWGYNKIQTYILESEPGTSLTASGWTLEATGCGGTPQGMRTNRPNGHEITEVTRKKKSRWAKILK